MKPQKQQQNPSAPGKQRQARRDRGAVLILTVVVIMVLTTLGMAMVTFTGTEEQTASVYRDSVQVRAVAESGVRIVQRMFQDPSDVNIVPQHGSVLGTNVHYTGTNETDVETSLNAIGIFRMARTGAVPARYTGGPTGTTNRFFLGPFNSSWGNIFGGVYSPPTNLYDLQFRRGTGTWINSKIDPLLATSSDINRSTGVITEITFYGPPMVNNKAYGICTVRVTAEKYNGTRVVARETIEAIIGDNNITPAILGNGNITSSNFDACGSGCEQIHANGNVVIGNGNISGGDPPISATGTVTSSGTISPAAQPNQPAVVAPDINPWDLAYRPSGTGLNKYYLLASRQLDVRWTNDNPGDDLPAIVCGLSQCQDYGLEYDPVSPFTVRTARAATNTGYLYKWNTTFGDWDQIDSAASGGTLDSGGAEPFSWTFVAGDDIDVSAGSGPDTAVRPFNKNRVPRASFQISGISPNNDSAMGALATFLVDGRVDMSGSIGSPRAWKVALVAVGSITSGSATNLRPATNSRVMVISGRDITMEASYNNQIQPCQGGPPTESNEAGLASGIIASHEQILFQGNSDSTGLVIAEHRVNLDVTVNNNATAIQFGGGSSNHGYVCGFPSWPWSRPTKPVIVSMTAAAN